MTDPVHLSGSRFGMLVVVGPAEIGPRGRTRSWQVACDCGQHNIVTTGNLLSGSTSSCGCLRRALSGARNRTHGLSKTPTWVTWKGLFQRCDNPSDPGYANYGGRGITVCKRWRDSFETFLADMGPRPAGMSLDRIDNDGNYEPGNCRWATVNEQARNRRSNTRITFNGETLTLVEWAARTHISYQALIQRVKKGWAVDRALTQPLQIQNGPIRRSPT